MQLKVKGMQLKAMQLKVGMQNNIGKGESRGNSIYMFHSPFLIFNFFPLFFSLPLVRKQSLIFVSKKLLSCLWNPFFQRGISHIHILPVVT